MALTAAPVRANDLLRLYQIAALRDATLQSATYQRDAAIEARPQALAALLPQIGAATAESRERAGYQVNGVQNAQAAACDLAADSMAHCYGNVRTLGLTLSQTLWSFESFNRLKAADLQAASAQASLLSAQQSLLLRLASAYFGILSSRDQLATNRGERAAFATLLNQAKARAETGVGPRSDVEQAQAFYDATEQSVIDAENTLDDAKLALTEIVGAEAGDIAPLRENIPLIAPDPASVDAWVRSALQDNPGVRAAELKGEAADRDIAAQRGRGLPTLSLTAASSRYWQGDELGGNQSLDTIGVSVRLADCSRAAQSPRRCARRARFTGRPRRSSMRRNARRNDRLARPIAASLPALRAYARPAVRSTPVGDALEASRRNVEFGTGTEFDLLNAQNNYYSAQRAYSQTRYDYLTNLLNLELQAGRLSEQDLANIDALLVERAP